MTLDLEALLAVLAEKGIAVAAVEGRVRVTPARAVTPELGAAIAANKAGLQDYLAGRFTILIRPDPDPPWTDPRPDLRGDRGRWMLLLEAAYARDTEIFGMLTVLRQMGARLEIAGPHSRTLPSGGSLPGWRIVRGKEMTAEEYADFRGRYMLRHSAALAALLAAPAAVP